MIDNFYTLKSRADIVISEIESACKLKESGIDTIWPYHDYCLDVDTYIKERVESLKLLVEYIENNV
jgi:hypothetical protein